MYKLLLSWRYLFTRYLALASIISVMLGVATLIVVNSVMGGFSHKLQDRMLGIQADILIESRSQDGFDNYERMMRRVNELCGNKVEAMAPVIDSFAIVHFRPRFKRSDGTVVYGDVIARPVQLVGVDPGNQVKVGKFGQYLFHGKNRPDVENCFSAPRLFSPRTLERAVGGEGERGRNQESDDGNDPSKPPPPLPPPSMEATAFGAVVGYSIASYRNPEAKAGDENKDVFALEPGDEIILTTASRMQLDGHDGREGYARAVRFKCVVTDFFKCDMAEFDSRFVYMDIKDLQALRTMQNRATAVQIKLKDYKRDAKEVVSILSKEYPYHMVNTWEEKQGPVLAAIAIERSILNILLFLIIAVAGFSILAIFFMMVIEKTRDIGILKALGASNGGVMGIFLSYGLALGILGAGLGTALGITIVVYINEIEKFIANITGQDVFPRQVYYFDEIPTDLQGLSIFIVNAGAVLIAVGASVFPSLRAALLHPVRALRYE